MRLLHFMVIVILVLNLVKISTAQSNKVDVIQPNSKSSLDIPSLEKRNSRQPRSFVKSYLSVSSRLLDSKSGNTTETLDTGKEYYILLTLAADRIDGVKINPLFHTQEAHIELTDKHVKFTEDQPQGSRLRSNAKELTVKVDSKTGKAKIKVIVSDGNKLAAKDVQLKVVADLMVCDEKGSYCVKTREESLLALVSGKKTMKSLPLLFNADKFNRVILKVGDKAPEFTTTSDESKTVSLADFQGKKNVIILFGRAHW